LKGPDKEAIVRRELAGLEAVRLLDGDWLTDFGRVHRCRPAVVALVDSEAGACSVFRLAAAYGLDVRVRGAGHSVDGQTLGSDVVLINRSDRPQVTMLDRGRVSVTGRTSWADLEHTLNRAGRTSPVLTDYLDLTVGGTLSVGGYGVRSVVAGSQIEQVERVRLVDRSGEARWVSRGEPGFARALGGLGRAGLIEEVVMRTDPRPERVDIQSYRHRDLERLLDAVQALETIAPDRFSAWITRGEMAIEYGSAGRAAGRLCPVPAEPMDTYTTRRHAFQVHTQRAVWLAGFAGHARVWADFKLPIASFATFARRTARLAERGQFRHLAIRYVLACRAGPPLGTLAPTDAAAGFYAGMGFYFMVPPGLAGAADAARAAVRMCLDVCLDLGGRPYLYGCCPWRPGEADALYGASFG
jgi:FAD/FMN-containing dehydrogenase